jgi:membrane protease YdiL (CAAX protease family)
MTASGEECVTAELADSSASPAVDDWSLGGCVWKVRDLIVGIGVVLAWRAAYTVGTRWLDWRPSGWGLDVYASSVFVWVLLYPLAVGSLRKSRPLWRKPRFVMILKETAIAAPIVIGVFVLEIAGFFAGRWLFGVDAVPSSGWEHARASKNSVATLTLLLGMFTVGPLAEEFFFRGFVYNALRRRLPATAAALLQAIVFSVLHFYAAFHLAIVFVLGIVLAAVYQWRKTLWAPFLVHSGINFIMAVLVAATMLHNAARPVLGVSGLPNQRGCIVNSTIPGSAAEQAGIMKGDIITTFDGKPIGGMEDLVEHVRKRNTGDRVRVEIQRDGEIIQKDVTLLGMP